MKAATCVLLLVRNGRQRLDGAQQAETGLVVVADDVRRHGMSAVVDDLGRVGLDHQIADRQDEAVAVDKDA